MAFFGNIDERPAWMPPKQDKDWFSGSGPSLILSGLAGISGANPTPWGQLGLGMAQMRRQDREKEQFQQLLQSPQLEDIPASVKTAIYGMGPQAGVRYLAQYQLKKMQGVKPQYKEVNGRIVRLQGDDAKEIYSAAPDQAQLQYKGLGELNKSEQSLRKEWQTLSKPYRVVRTFADQILNAPATGPGALSLVFGFMKVLDPTSIVRPSEQASAENAGGVPSKIRGIWNKVLAGRMDPGLVEEFKEETKRILAERRERLMKTEKHIKGIAIRRKMDPRNIIGQDFFDSQSDAVTTPANNDPLGIR